MNSPQELPGLISVPRARLFSLLALALLAVAVLIGVANIAWVSEDSFISFRYVSNLLAGYGPVFNEGERVLGYTHPLWFLLLAACSFVFGDPVLVAIGLGMVLTLAALLLLGWMIYLAAGRSWPAVWVMSLVVVVLLASDAWLSFQTGGLENPLSHLLLILIAGECFFYHATRSGRLVLWLTLLCMCRPDFVFIAAPVGLLVAIQARWPADAGKLLLAASPGLLWLAFAWSYYGYPLPNTGTAKLAVYPSAMDALAQGAAYLYDWFRYETLSALAAAAFLLIAVALGRGGAVRAFVLGCVLQLCWVVWAGGDFMRGRFLLVVLTASMVIGALVLAEYVAARPRAGRRALGAVTAAILLLGVVGPLSVADSNQKAAQTATGIVNERLFYPGYTLEKYLQLGHPDVGSGMRYVENLRNFVLACGPVTVHDRHPGTLAYLAGPGVSVIDTLGLTDRFVAKLPRSYLVESLPRPGHPDKYIPVAYLVERGDVALVAEWFERLAAADCALKDAVKPFPEENLYLAPGNQIVRLSFAAD